MNALTYDLAAVRTLWRHDLRQLWQRPLPLVVAMVQAAIFALAASPGTAGDRPRLCAGAITLAALLASVFMGANAIGGPRRGIVQLVTTSPASRLALVIGQCLGVASVSLAPVFLLLLLSPLVGIDLGTVSWPLLLTLLVLTTLALASATLIVAWSTKSPNAYYGVLLSVLIPLWALSGVMAPSRAPPLAADFNPLGYVAVGLGQALGSETITSPWLVLVVVGSSCLLLLVAATWVCSRRPD